MRRGEGDYLRAAFTGGFPAPPGARSLPQALRDAPALHFHRPQRSPGPSSQRAPVGPTSSCPAPGPPPARRKGASCAAGSSVTASWASAAAHRCSGCEGRGRGGGSARSCTGNARYGPQRGRGGDRYLLNILAASSRISPSHTRSVSSTCRRNSASRRLQSAGSCAGPAAGPAAIAAAAAILSPTARPGPAARREFKPGARLPPRTSPPPQPIAAALRPARPPYSLRGHRRALKSGFLPPAGLGSRGGLSLEGGAWRSRQMDCGILTAGE